MQRGPQPWEKIGLRAERRASGRSGHHTCETGPQFARREPARRDDPADMRKAPSASTLGVGHGVQRGPQPRTQVAGPTLEPQGDPATTQAKLRPSRR